MALNKLIGKETKYDGRRFKVIQKKYERDDGLKIIRDCVEPGNAVIVIAVNENNEIYFIEQYRETIENVALELPAGMIDENENPEDAARRELEEETGIKLLNKCCLYCFTFGNVLAVEDILDIFVHICSVF